MPQVYARVWLEQFDALWTLSDHTVSACHAHVVLHHHLSDAQLAAIRDSGVPVLSQVCARACATRTVRCVCVSVWHERADFGGLSVCLSCGVCTCVCRCTP
jgi:hypothetical protein